MAFAFSASAAHSCATARSREPSPSPRTAYPPDSLTRTPGSRTFRSREAYVRTAASACEGDSSPHRASISSAAVAVRPSRSRRAASRARCWGSRWPAARHRGGRAPGRARRSATAPAPGGNLDASAPAHAVHGRPSGSLPPGHDDQLCQFALSMPRPSAVRDADHRAGRGSPHSRHNLSARVRSPFTRRGGNTTLTDGPSDRRYRALMETETETATVRKTEPDDANTAPHESFPRIISVDDHTVEPPPSGRTACRRSTWTPAPARSAPRCAR